MTYTIYDEKKKTMLFKNKDRNMHYQRLPPKTFNLCNGEWIQTLIVHMKDIISQIIYLNKLMITLFIIIYKNIPKHSPKSLLSIQKVTLIDEPTFSFALSQIEVLLFLLFYKYFYLTRICLQVIGWKWHAWLKAAFASSLLNYLFNFLLLLFFCECKLFLRGISEFRKDEGQ